MQVNAELQKKLLKKWGLVLENGGQKIASVQDKITVAQVLENTYKFYKKHGFFTEASAGNVTNTVNPVLTAGQPSGTAYDVTQGVLGPNDYVLPNVVMPMLRRIFPTLMAHELVSVQPMTGPVGFAFAIRAQGPNGSGYGNPTENYEYGFENPAWTTGRRAQGVPGEFSRYAGGADTRGEGLHTQEAEGFGANPVFGRFGNSGVPGKYPMAAITIKHESVTAKERKLGSEWSAEMAEDLEAVHGIDIETEMVNLLSFQIGSEIDQELLDVIVHAAAISNINGVSTVMDWAPATADGLDQMGRISTLLTTITKAANDIAITTRRGSGNFVVASVNVTSALQQLASQKLVSDGKTMPSVPASAVGALSKEGLINDGRQLLVKDTYATVDYAVVGYKGTQTGDSGIIYCPYIPVTLVKTVDPFTLSPRLGARTRYGLLNNPFDASTFYRLVKVDFGGAYTFSNSNRYFFGGPAEAAKDAAKENFANSAVAQSISISAEGEDASGEGADEAADDDQP